MGQSRLSSIKLNKLQHMTEDKHKGRWKKTNLVIEVFDNIHCIFSMILTHIEQSTKDFSFILEQMEQD